MATAKLLITDDHEVVRQGVRTILKNRPQWEICGEAVNGKDAIEKAQKLHPDVIIMDITMPEMGGIEATREIIRLNPAAAILIFTMHESSHLSDTVREAGARGIVLKSHAARDLVEALEALMSGRTFFGSGASGSQGAQRSKADEKPRPTSKGAVETRSESRWLGRTVLDHVLKILADCFRISPANC